MPGLKRGQANLLNCAFAAPGGPRVGGATQRGAGREPVLGAGSEGCKRMTGRDALAEVLPREVSEKRHEA